MTAFYKQISADLVSFKQREQTDFANWADNSKVEMLDLLKQLNDQLEADTFGSLIAAINKKLPITGGAVEGPLALMGPLILTEGIHYGTEEPTAGVEGQLFLVEITE